ncbi:hypothetical protein CRYUN_Cryun13aG0033800 [Craigia yunnanensis]
MKGWASRSGYLTLTGLFQHVFDQIIACALKENLLPEISREKPIINQSQKSKAVLVTSWSAGYFERVRDMYWEHPTVTEEIVSVYQPSHEEYQQTEKRFHNRKAWAETYLLSLTDVLVTSSWSTFGYVAQSLGGLKPLILYKPEKQTAQIHLVVESCQWNHDSMSLPFMIARPKEALTQVHWFLV